MSGMDQNWITHRVEASGVAGSADLLQAEWVLTNGTGAYAMGTAAGVNTRRYHGLLIAASHPPVGRLVALHQVIEELRLKRGPDEVTLPLTACQFIGGDGAPLLSPGNLSLLRRFDRGLTCAWEYEWGPTGRAVRLRKEVALHVGAQAVTIRYTLSNLSPELGQSACLRLGPMLSLRDFHGMIHRHTAPNLTVSVGQQGVGVSNGTHHVALRCDAGRFLRQRDWWYGIYYARDRERGQEDREDHFVPGFFEIDFDLSQPTRTYELTAALGPVAPAGLDAASSPSARLRTLTAVTKHLAARPGIDRCVSPHLLRVLALASDDFIVGRKLGGASLSTVLAGYPWFADWGRDTFIALPGLLLCTGRHAEARAVLKVFAQAVRDGLVPNRFDDYDDHAAHYNTVDASLWFIRAALAYRAATGDEEAWRQWIAPAAQTIVEAYARGTLFGIRMDDDGLIAAGGPDTQLTWMDAAAHDEHGRFVVFTPRPGKAVEINALWHDALRGLALTGHEPLASRCAALAERVKASFLPTFWNESRQCLYDHVYTDPQGQVHRDASIRPNQALAAASPFGLLPPASAARVVAAVRRHLLTPFGLRTLPADDPRYHPWYSGPPFQRDEAYHQGTIWPWLIGPYAEAVLRSGGFSDEARAEALNCLVPLIERLAGDGLGQLHEVHEAAPPHRPVGCIAQAWSVGELIRALWLITEPAR